MDKFHYYDGKPYEILFDTVLKEVRDIIARQVETGSTIIDIGCGTGSLVFNLAKKCKTATGVELSFKMVKHAKRRQQKNGKENVNFIHGNAASMPHFRDKQFDYATISMAIHEMPPNLRIKVLTEAKRIAKKIIIADYITPQPFNFTGVIIRVIEFLAGIEHFRNFKDFQKNNGIDQLLQNCQLSIRNKLVNKNGIIKITVVE